MLIMTLIFNHWFLARDRFKYWSKLIFRFKKTEIIYAISKLLFFFFSFINDLKMWTTFSEASNVTGINRRNNINKCISFIFIVNNHQNFRSAIGKLISKLSTIRPPFQKCKDTYADKWKGNAFWRFSFRSNNQNKRFPVILTIVYFLSFRTFCRYIYFIVFFRWIF